MLMIQIPFLVYNTHWFANTKITWQILLIDFPKISYLTVSIKRKHEYKNKAEQLLTYNKFLLHYTLVSSCLSTSGQLLNTAEVKTVMEAYSLQASPSGETLLLPLYATARLWVTLR